MHYDYLIIWIFLPITAAADATRSYPIPASPAAITNVPNIPLPLTQSTAGAGAGPSAGPSADPQCRP